MPISPASFDAKAHLRLFFAVLDSPKHPTHCASSHLIFLAILTLQYSVLCVIVAHPSTSLCTSNYYNFMTSFTLRLSLISGFNQKKLLIHRTTLFFRHPHPILILILKCQELRRLIFFFLTSQQIMYFVVLLFFLRRLITLFRIISRTVERNLCFFLKNKHSL